MRELNSDLNEEQIERKCSDCGMMHPFSIKRFDDDKWRCIKCGRQYFKNERKCFDCGKTKGMLGTSEFDDNWRCTKCHNKFWKKKIEERERELEEKGYFT